MANLELSALTEKEWASPNLTYTDGAGAEVPVVWRYRMPNPNHKARILNLRMTAVNDSDAMAVARGDISEAELAQNMKLREAVKTKYAVQRFAFMACVVGVVGISDGDGPLSLSDHRHKEDVDGTPLLMLSEGLMDALEAGAVADDIAALGQHIADLASLSGAQKKP